MQIVKEEVRDIVKGKLEVPRAPHLKEAMMSSDSCFGVLYSKTSEICQEECTLPVQFDGEVKPCNEVCAGVTQQSFQRLKQGGRYVCTHCDKPFGNKGAYVHHLQAKHDESGDAMTQRTYKCDECGLKFDYEIGIEMHGAVQHDK